MNRFYYFENICVFLSEPNDSILGKLFSKHGFDVEQQQNYAWKQQIEYLKKWLSGVEGRIIFEYCIPRVGKRIDCVIISGGVLYAIEFKVGASKYERHFVNQAIDYALDLKNFHKESYDKIIVPILICTESKEDFIKLELYPDGMAKLIKISGSSLSSLICKISSEIDAEEIAAKTWVESEYKPTPTIIEAAQALYQGHCVAEISRSDAGAINLTRCANVISDIIQFSKKNRKKSICFLTGVPGAGKTLAGLNLVNSWQDYSQSEHAVFLSGNAPLVEVLREALARDEVKRNQESGTVVRKNRALDKAEVFIQNIHHFRDEALKGSKPPNERIVIFDEAQRAWSREQTASFMKRKKGVIDFNYSEPEFLISYLDRHQDWATIVCLIGGGQEINTGEAGINEWFASLTRSFPDWSVFVSSQLFEKEFDYSLHSISEHDKTRYNYNDDLHLSLSIRSFRSENVAKFIKTLLDCNIAEAKDLYEKISKTYPIVLSRNLEKLKNWVREKARGTERYGIVASSGGIRLRPYGINVKAKIETKNWFLQDASDIRSSYFMEEVATEFDIQGLELDWTIVAWDADLRRNGDYWEFKSFSGTSWKNIQSPVKQEYLKNAYRVLLTRARQGMAIFIPEGQESDDTGLPDFYNTTFHYLGSLSIQEI